MLWMLLLIAAFCGMSSGGFDRLREAHLIKDLGLPTLGGLDPVVWFGAINAGTLVLGYLAAEVLGRRTDVSNAAAVAARLLFVLDP
jgi:MFS transporter, DHA3 family, tetracycline resistance protein